MKKSNHYIDNEQLHKAMEDYIMQIHKAQRLDLPRPPVTDYIGGCILKIAQNLATKSSFAGYSFKDEMISDGIMNCLLYIHNYDPKISTNAFSYFTFIIFRAFLRRIQKEKDHQYIRQKSLLKSVHDKSYYTSGSGGEDSNTNDDDVNLDLDLTFAEEFVKNYEKKLEEQKAKAKK